MIGTSSTSNSRGREEGLSSFGRHRSSSSSSSDVVESPPEPNHNVPPPPHQPQQTFMIPPWTPWTPNPQQQTEEIPPPSSCSGPGGSNRNDAFINGMVDDESLPSIPDVPSPYSPPPASLFSVEEEFPSKSVRKHKPPHDEFRMPQHHSMMYQDNQNHNNGVYNNNSIPSDEKHSMNHSQYNRQQLLPTVLYLKKDLEESHASMHLLQQENKALASECDKFQNEMHIWKERQSQIVTLKDQQIAQLQEQLRISQLQSNETKEIVVKERATATTLKEEVERFSKQLEASTATNQRLDAHNSDLKQELELKSNEIKNLRSTMKDQSQVSALKMKDAMTSYEAKLQKLKDENQSLTIEADRLKAMHHEAVQRGTKDVAAAGEALRSELAMIRAELTDAHQTIIDLRKGTTNVNGELMKRDDLMKDLQEEVENLRTSNKTQTEEIQRLTASVADATEREEKLITEIERTQKKSAEEQKKLEDEMQRLTTALQKAETDQETLEKSLTQALETSYSKYKSLRSEKESLQQELLTMKSQKQKHSPTSVVVVERNNELEAEVENLKSALSKMTLKCNELRAEKSTLTKKLAQYKKDESSTPRDDPRQPPKVFTFQENHDTDKNDDELIPHRLERIRDAAERAALAQDHRRELSRLKLEHEKEMKLLSERHEQDIKDVFEEAKAEVTARSRELRRHLQSEYETKIGTLERRYQSDLARMQREFDKNTAVAEEAMQAAASEVATVTEQLKMETTARESLQSTIHELEHKLVTEQQKNKLSSELMMNRMQWQHDTNNLIETIQQECNTVFTQNLIRNRTESPRCVTIVSNNNDNEDDKGNLRLDDNDEKSSTVQLDESYLSRIEHGAGASMTNAAFPVHRTPWKSDRFTQKERTTSYNSPLDVSQALDETEALVRSLVAK